MQDVVEVFQSCLPLATYTLKSETIYAVPVQVPYLYCRSATTAVSEHRGSRLRWCHFVWRAGFVRGMTP